MTGQFRDDLGVYQDSCHGKRVWIVGTGPSLDDIVLKDLAGEYIFALNAAMTLFKNYRKFVDAWWLWWDLRTYREVWPHLTDWTRVQTIIAKKGMEMMRQHRGAGRYLSYGTSKQFIPKRTVAETAILIADFLGFDEAVLVGIDGMATRENNEPYCKKINPWKSCYFMDRSKPQSWAKSAVEFDAAMENLLKKVPRIKVIQTSDIYPNRDRFSEYCSISDVLGRKMKRRAEKVHNAARKGF